MAGLCDVVLIAVDFNLVIACDHIRLVDINVRPLLIGGKDDLVVDAQRTGVLKDHSQVLGTLHVVLASVVVVANVRDLLVDRAPVVPLSLVVVVLVAVVLIWVLIVLVLPSDLENNLVLLLLVQVIWINQLELRVMTDVVELFNLLVFVNNIQINGFLLDQELRVLMLEEWRKVLVLPLGCLLWVKQRFSVHHLEFVISVVSGEVRVLHELWVQVKFMTGEWVDSCEGDHVG